MLKSKKLIALILMVMVLVVTAGCNKESNSVDKSGNNDQKVVTEKNKQSQSEKVTANDKQSDTVKVYYPNADGTKLIASTKKLGVGEDKYTTAMKQLISGTAQKGEVSIVPKNTQLRSVKVEKNIAYVDFSSELIKNFNGGSTGEIMMVGAIVNTLTEFPEVKKVQILVEGKKIDTIAGHMDTLDPLKRFDDIIKK